MGPRHLTVGPAEATRPQQAAPCRQLSRWMQAPTLSAQRLRQPVWGPSTVRWATGPLGPQGRGDGWRLPQSGPDTSACGWREGHRGLEEPVTVHTQPPGSLWPT